jgi:hypothetical protein
VILGFDIFQSQFINLVKGPENAKEGAARRFFRPIPDDDDERVGLL